MTAKRFFPWLDIFLFGGIGLFGVVVAILATLNRNNTWWGILLAWVVVSAFIAVAVTVVWGKLASRPNFITRHGVAVWTGGIEEITQQMVEQAFIDYALLMDNVTIDGITITREKLYAMYEKVMVEWSGARVSSIGNGWFIKDAAGLTKDFGILVWWPGSIRSSALFHELHHIVWREILGKQPDYDHKEVAWWRLLA